jgi:hypothetical protein
LVRSGAVAMKRKTPIRKRIKYNMNQTAIYSGDEDYK